MCCMRTTHRTGLHSVGLLKCEDAPLMDAMATQTIYVALIVGRPAGAALNPEPQSWQYRPFRIGLPPAVEHSMRGNINPSSGTETWWHFFNLLLPLLPFLLRVTELCHLQHQREKSSLTGLLIQRRSSKGPEMRVISGCSELSRHNEQRHQHTLAWSRGQKWQVCVDYHISKWSTTGHHLSLVIAPKCVCAQRVKRETVQEENNLIAYLCLSMFYKSLVG